MDLLKNTNNIQVSVVIVNYKNPPLILQCVKSIMRFEKTVEYEIIVVDNNSEDDTEQQLRTIYPNLKWIQMGYNSGFAKANNAGVRVAEGKYIFYLNSDTIFIEPVFEKIIQEMQCDKTIGTLSCMLLNRDKTPQVGCDTTTTTTYSFKRLVRRNPIFIKLFHTQRTSKREFLKIQNIVNNPSCYLHWLVGANVFMRKSDIENYSLQWDEDFFMYFEDMFLGYSVRKVGLKCKWINTPKIIHLGGASTSMSQKTFNIFKTSEITYLKKIYGNLIKTLYVTLFKLEVGLEVFLEKRKYGEIRNEELKNEAEYIKKLL